MTITRVTCDVCGAEIPPPPVEGGSTITAVYFPNPRVTHYRLTYPDGKVIDLCDLHGQAAVEGATRARPPRPPGPPTQFVD